MNQPFDKERFKDAVVEVLTRPPGDYDDGPKPQDFKHNFTYNAEEFDKTLRVHALQEAVKLVTGLMGADFDEQLLINITTGGSSIFIPLVKKFESYLQTGEFTEVTDDEKA